MKTTMRYHLTSIKMATIEKKKPTEKNSVGKDVEKLEPFSTIGGNVKWYNRCGKQYVGFSKD